jgi:hypothetical protein
MSYKLNIKLGDHHTAIIRSVIGVVASLVIAILLGIVTPQIAAIFTTMLLGKDAKALGILKSLGAVGFLFIVGLLGMFVGGIIQDFVWESILILGLVIFWSFRLVVIPEPVRMLFLIFTLLFPFLSLTAEPLASFVFGSILLNMVISLAVTESVFLFFPDKRPKLQTTKVVKKTTINYNLDKLALNGLLMLLPAVLFFFYFQLNTFLITFIFIMVLGMDPLIYKSKYGHFVLFANILGGGVALIAYNLLTIAPDFFFYIFLVTASALFFTYKMFSDKKTAAVYPMAYRGFFVILSVIFTSKDTVADNLSSRLFGIILAVLYVVLAYQFLNTVNNPIQSSEETGPIQNNLKPIAE